MDLIYESFRNFSAFFTDTDVVIPAIQMIYYVGIINICMLLQRYRLCFLISLVCSFYWMFILNKENFVSLDGTFGIEGYFALGIVLFILLASLISFMGQKETLSDFLTLKGKD